VEELTREVSLCIRYYTVTFRGHRVTRLLVSGGGAYEPLLCPTLAPSWVSRWRRPSPFRAFAVVPRPWTIPSQEGVEWAVALGLALKGWPTGCGSVSSLRPRPILVPTS